MTHFVVLAADPPWCFDNRGTRAAAEGHYGTMSIEELCALPIVELVADDAVLLLWCPSALLLEGVGTRVARAWGFEPKQILVWKKDKIGLGNYFRNAHEPAILAVRGRATRLVRDKGIANVVEAPRGRHSAKPEVVYDLLDRLVPDGPRAELFARRARKGWVCLGNELPDGGSIDPA